VALAQINLWLSVIGGLALVLGLSTGILARHGYLPSEPIIAVAVGVAVGPEGLSLLSLLPVGEPLPLLEELARLTVAFAVTSIALRLEPAYYSDRAKSLAVLLLPGMVAMWLLSTLVVYATVSTGVVVALLVGAIVTPTDPVLANSIVVGRTATENIPKRLRYLLSGEAGVNDGAAYPFVILSVLLLNYSPERALADWVSETVLWEVVGAVAVGLLVGAAVGKIEQWESGRDFLEETSVFTITVALTLFVLGFSKLVGTDDILAVFVAGVAYNQWADPQDEAKEQRVEEVINRLFTVPGFVVFGMVLPWSEWVALGWQGPLVVAGILLFRRLPMVLTFRRFIPPLDRPQASLFVGWFGPIGIAAVFYAILAMERTGSELPWVLGSLVVFGSVLAHGLTAVPATHWYGEIGDENDSW